MLSEESLARMMAPQNTTAVGRMGLVFYETKLAGTRFVGHDGGTMVAGLQESLGLFPRHRSVQFFVVLRSQF